MLTAPKDLKEALRATYGDQITEDGINALIDEDRRERHKALIRPSKFEEECKANGLREEHHRAVMRLVTETWLDHLYSHVRKNQSTYRELGEQVLPAMQEIGAFTEDTTTSDITNIYNFLGGIVRDVGPLLAPIADLIGVVPVPTPDSKIAYFKAWGSTDSTFYTAPWRLRDNVDTSFDEWSCGSITNEVKFTIATDTLSALAYAILSDIALCAQQDAMSQYGINLDAEAKTWIAYYIARTTIRRVLTTLTAAAAGGAATWTSSAAAGSIYTKDSWGAKNYLRTIFDSMEDVDGAMTDARFEGFDVAWCSRNVVSYMTKSNEFTFVPKTGGGTIMPQLRFSGDMLRGKWDVVRDVDAPEDTLLCLKRATNWSDTCCILGIYVPLMFVPAQAMAPFIDPGNMINRRAGITRQGIKVVDAYRAGLVTIS